MPELDCLVVWPSVLTDGAILPPYAIPEHRCMLPADHVHDRIEVQQYAYAGPGRLGFELRDSVIVVPHKCHCGATLPVRDAGVGE